jgi:glycine dehydrogenase subunit 1
MDYVPHTDEQVREMLRTIGVDRFEDLLTNVPAEARCRTFDVPRGLSELELLQHCETLALPTRSLRDTTSFLGFGAYHHVIPSVVDALSSRGEWLTPYTPYQAEASQGTLQLIYEFQTMVCELLQMDVANASMYDGASALAEAAVMALKTTGRTRLLVSETVHPHARQVLATYVQGVQCVVQDVPHRDGATDVDALAAAMGPDVAAVIVQQPNVFGALEPVARAAELAHGAGALLIDSVYPISLGLLTPPGAEGADIAVGEGRCLGSPIAYGGPGLGLFAAKQPFLRRMPGRLAGCSVDHDQRRAFTLTLQTREQHIRREQATSNICTNEGWLCVRATIFLSLLGPQGLRELAELNLQRAHETLERLRAVKWIEPAFERPFFNEFTVRYTGGRTVEGVNRALWERGILGGVSQGRWFPALGEAATWCVTDAVSLDQVDRAVDVLKSL